MTLSHAYSEPRKPDRLVVLGAGGFLGRSLLRTSASAGIQVEGLGSRDIDLADVSAGARLAERLRPKDVVVFLAALTPDKGRDSGTLMRNLAMCRAVCEATRAVEIAHLVCASSDAVYSFDTALISEDTAAIPIDLYGAMHRTRELMLAAEAKAPLAIFRIPALYGAGDTHNSYGPNRFLRQALKDGNILLFGDGEERRDHVYVDDAADLILRVVLRGSTGLLNLATGTSTPFRVVAEMTAQCFDRAISIKPSPRQNPIMHRHFDVTNTLRAFPTMRFRPLQEGLPTALAGMRAAARG
jgi:nucleoside-diphosphate-sugar epimerase